MYIHAADSEGLGPGGKGIFKDTHTHSERVLRQSFYKQQSTYTPNTAHLQLQLLCSTIEIEGTHTNIPRKYRRIFVYKVQSWAVLL